MAKLCLPADKPGRLYFFLLACAAAHRDVVAHQVKVALPAAAQTGRRGVVDQQVKAAHQAYVAASVAKVRHSKGKNEV